ncbi:hypothetical protein OPQ81_002058 [Rhizoctonia solani]|nr:hypothetical protein OPQ81_002058 [Rhizoctonia solani]
MSKEEISRLFDCGVNILNQAKSVPRSPNYGDSLAEAKRYLDQVIDLAERDDPSFDNYVHTWASIHALCLAFVDYSLDLDSYLASSPLIETLNGWFHNGRGQTTELYVGDQDLDDFWDGVAQIQDDRYLSLDNPALLSPGALAASVDALGEAISRSTDSATFSRIWNICRCVVLYLKLDVYNPSEISLCISSLAKAISNNTGNDSHPDVIDPFLLKALDSILHNPQMEFRKNSLRSLAAFYGQRQLSMFNKFWNSYQTGQGAGFADLDDAISASFEGILWTQKIDIPAIVRFDLIFGYASAEYERFNNFQRLEDLQDSVQPLQEVQSYSEVENNKMVAARQLYAAISAHLAFMLSESREAEDWEKSLTFWKQSVATTEPDSPDLAGRLFELGKLASKLYRGSENWNSEYFLEARDTYQRAAIVTFDTSFTAQVYFELASILHDRFLKTGAREDFNDSVSAGSKACDLVRQTPSLAQGGPYWTGVYLHCVRMLRDVQENFKQDDKIITEKLELVIELCELIISHPHHTRLLAMNRLGLAYATMARVQRRGGHSPAICLASLEKALELHEAALEETQPDDYLLHARRAFVGTTYYQMSELADIDDATRSRYLDLSIHYFREARMAGRHSLNNSVRLAKALEDRYKLLKQRSDLDDRLFAALRRMTQLGLSSTERQDAIVYSVGHACDAAASALKNNQAEVAVELLEEGRNLFFSQLLPMQIDTTPIRLQDPDLALDLEETLAKFIQYHRATDSAGYQANQVASEGGFADEINEVAHDYNPESLQLLHYAKELERYLADVRKLPGLSDFMSLKPFSDLKQAAQHCPVVYLSISRFRCDALIVGSAKDSGVLVVPLLTTSAKVIALSQTMRKAIVQQGRGVRGEAPQEAPQETSQDRTRAIAHRAIKRPNPAQEVQIVLRQLWDLIVRPVLSALDYLRPGNAPSADDLPQICWCPSGPSAVFLPLHAAGDYSRGPEHWAMTHVISTYTPTLASLHRSLERESHTSARDARMLLISQPASPPNLPLPGVVVERDRILATFDEIEGPGNVTPLHDSAGQVEEVVKQLPSHEMLHLACHGIQDMVNPLESSVVLYDGRLTIREIIKTPLPNAELVYLSACQTATGSISTPDESFSLAGSFLFAGYKGAVATMWSINDQDGCDIATAFYKHTLQKDGSPTANAALALHRAVQELREANPGIEPSRWIAFVYFGVPGPSSALDQATPA